MTARALAPSRGLAFALLVVACVVVAGGYVGWAALRGQAPAVVDPDGPPAARGDAASLAATAAEPHLVFQNTTLGPDYAKAAVLPLDDMDGTRLLAELTCDRLYQAAGRGLCLFIEPGAILRHWALVFDESFRETSRIELFGPPSRARVSADGRYGAATVFVFGHSYAEGSFSTATTLIDMAEGSTIALLEDFETYRDDELIQAQDVNYWGVTFTADSNIFYATLATGGETYLVRGDIAAEEMRVVHENVECPSLSPDGSRIAYKKRVGGLGDWRFTVLDLETLTETPLAETESIDDQLEWLDDETIVYGKFDDLWTVPSDGSGAPEVFVRRALSPVVIR